LQNEMCEIFVQSTYFRDFCLNYAVANEL